MIQSAEMKRLFIKTESPLSSPTPRLAAEGKLFHGFGRIIDNRRGRSFVQNLLATHEMDIEQAIAMDARPQMIHFREGQAPAVEPSLQLPALLRTALELNQKMDLAVRSGRASDGTAENEHGSDPPPFRLAAGGDLLGQTEPPA